MATKVNNSIDDEEEELLRQENERRTTEARSKIAEIREKSKERSEDDKRKRALESIHRMEWLKNKNDFSVVQGGTNKGKSRGRRKERVEVVKNLEDLGLPPCKPPSARYPTSPPLPQNAWSMKPGSALFSSTASTRVTLRIKDYDEEAMLKKALEESLAYPEEGLFYNPEESLLCNPEEYGNVSPWAPSSSNKSRGLARSVLGQEPSRNENPRRHGQGNNFEHSDYGYANDLGRSIQGQKNDILHSDLGQRSDIGHSVHAQKNDLELTDRKTRNDTDPMSEISNRSNRRSLTKRQNYESPDEELKEDESYTIEKKDISTSSGGKIDNEEEPIDYYKKGKELAEKRARERALKLAAQEAEEEKEKYQKVAQETQENVSSKTEHKSSPHKTLRFFPDSTYDNNNNRELKEATQTLPDTKATIMRLSAEAERLTKTLEVPKVAVECQLPQVHEEQRQFWTSKQTQMEPAPDEAPQPNSTTMAPSQEVSTTSQSTQRLYTPEDFIVMDNTETSEMPDMNELSLGYGVGFDQYSPYTAYQFGIGAYPNIGVLPHYVGNQAIQTPNSFPVVTSPSQTFITSPAAPLMNNTAQNMYAERPNGLQTSNVATHCNATTVEVTSASPKENNLSPTYAITKPSSAAQNFHAGLQTSNATTHCNATNVEVTSASPQGSSLSPSFPITKCISAAQKYFAANMSPPNVTTPVASDGYRMSETFVNYLVPEPSPGVPASTPNSGQEVSAPNIRNVDRWLQLNILLSQCIMSQLNGAATLGGNVSWETLSALIPPLPIVPQTSLSDVAKPAPPPPDLEPNIGLPYTSSQAPVNPSQSALLTTSDFSSVPVGPPNAVLCMPPVPAGYPLVQSPHRLPGSFIRGPSGRGRGVVQTLH